MNCMSILWHSDTPLLRHDPRFHVELISRTLSDKKKGEDLCIIYYPSQAIQFLQMECLFQVTESLA